MASSAPSTLILVPATRAPTPAVGTAAAAAMTLVQGFTASATRQ